MNYNLSVPRPLTRNEEDNFKIILGNHKHYKTKNKLFLIDDTYNDPAALFIRQNPEILDLYKGLTYSVDLPHISFCPEYKIFNLINPKSIILNFNHDHLAETFIKNRTIFSVHGSISTEIRQSLQNCLPLILSERLDASDAKNIFLKNFCLASKEHEHELLETKTYQKLLKCLRKNTYSYIVVIGYSFFRRNCYTIYDVVTYDIIRSYLLDNKKCQVIIIDPEPSFPADILANNISEISYQLYKIYWNYFTYSLFKFFERKKSCQFSSEDLKIFDRLYIEFSNKC